MNGPFGRHTVAAAASSCAAFAGLGGKIDSPIMSSFISFQMHRRATQSTSEQLHAANAEVLRLQEQLKEEAAAASRILDRAPSKHVTPCSS